MSNPNINTTNLDARYTKPSDVDAKIAAQATADAGQYAQQWKANTTYSNGQKVIAPDGSIVQANTSFTSGASYNSSNWATLTPTSVTLINTAASYTRQALAASVLARISRADGEKIALYSGTAPVWTNAASSQITSGILRAPRRTTPTYGNAANSYSVNVDTDPCFRYLNTPYLAYGTTYPDYLFTRTPLLIGGASQAAYWYPRISFYYDGQTFEWYGKAFQTAAQFRLRIDGKLVTPDLTTVATGLTPGNFYYFKCDLGSQAMRLIEIETGNDPSFGGIIVEPTAVIQRGPLPSLRLCALTDSIGAGAGSFSRFTSWAGALTELIGNDVAMYNAGIGGTGYLTATQGTNDFITRVPDVVASKPDILFIEGGQNDGGYTPAQIQAAATTLFNALTAALPNTLIFVLGVYSATTPSSQKMLQDAALRAAATASSIYFISLVDPTDATVSGSGVPTWLASTSYSQGDQVIDLNGVPQTCITGHTSTASFDQTKFRANAVFFGTGKTGTTNGDGNADVMIQSDGIHPTPRGCIALGRRAYYGMRKQLSVIAASGTGGIAK